MSKDPDVIESEIEETRSRIENRLHTLGEQFTPTRIVEQAFGTGDMEPGETFEAIADRARRSPISTALVGAGLLGLFLAGRRESYPSQEGSHRGYSNPSSSADPAERLRENIDNLKDASTAAVSSAKQAAYDAKERARLQATLGSAELRDSTSSAQETVSNGINTLSQKAGHLVDRAGNALSDAGHLAANARDKATQAARAAPVRAKAQSEAVVDWVKDNPVPAGLMALAAGAALSSFFSLRNSNAPSSRYQASHQLHEKARAEDDSMVFIGHPDDNLNPGRHVDPTPEKPSSRRSSASKKSASTTKSRAKKAVAKASKVKPKSIKRSTAVLGAASEKTSG